MSSSARGVAAINISAPERSISLRLKSGQLAPVWGSSRSASDNSTPTETRGTTRKPRSNMPTKP